MSIARAELSVLPHAVFLHRISEPEGSKRRESRLGQGAFLALRLIDLLEPARDPVPPDAFEYQWAATDRFCRDLRGIATEGGHLHGLVASTAAAYRQSDIRLLTPGLFAYAHFLEDALHLEEALDALDTLRRVAGARASGADAVALSLRAGRVNRKLNRFDEADAAYAEAEERAKGVGDRHSELLSRIGRAVTVQGRGNFPEAEQRLVELLGDARKAGERAVEAHAEHNLAAVLQHRGSPDMALRHAWRAFELFEDAEARLRALGDVGVMLLTLGDAVAAERALNEVIRRATTQGPVTNAMIELMHCASYRRDQVGFERMRARCHKRERTMPPNILADYYLKAGIGEARFGRFRRGEASLRRALTIAEGAGLHAFVFKIERIMKGLGACEESLPAEPVDTIDSDAVREVSASLAQLVAEPA